MKRVLILGCGRAGADLHLPSYLQRDDCSVVAVCDMDVAKARAAAKKWGVERVYKIPARACREMLPDIVSVCTPPATHRELVACAASAGASILLEKPIADSLPAAEDILTRCSRAGVGLSVVHNYRFAPGIKAMFSAILGGRIGTPLCVTKTWTTNPGERMVAATGHWAQALPGGRWTEAMPHHLYIAQELLGDLRLLAVEVEEVGRSPVLPANRVAALLSSGSAWFTIQMGLSHGSRYGTMSIMGTSGTICATFPSAWMRSYGAEDGWIELCPPRVSSSQPPASASPNEKSGHREFIAEFLAWLDGQGQNPTPEHHALETMRLTHEIAQGIEKACKGA